MLLDRILKCLVHLLNVFFIEIEGILINHDKNVIIGTIYRPPATDIKEFNENMSHLLLIIQNENELAYIMGDYNINLLNSDKHIQTSEFVDIMFGFGYYPLINKPTRVKNTTATLIDNIFTNDLGKLETMSGIIVCDISDHYPVFHILKTRVENCVPTSTKKRQFNDKNISQFRTNLSTYNWSNLYLTNDPQIAFSEFYNTFKTNFDECFPVKICNSSYGNKKTWLTPALRTSIRTKNKLYKKYKKYPFLSHERVYKKYRNKLCQLLRNAERSHYHYIITKYKQNLKKSWQIIKDIIGKKQGEKVIANKFKVDNKIIMDPVVIANSFNNFYINIGHNLASKIPNPNSNINPTSYIKKEYINSLYLKPIEDNEIRNIIRDLRNTSPGHDGITAFLIKNVTDEIDT